MGQETPHRIEKRDKNDAGVHAAVTTAVVLRALLGQVGELGASLKRAFEGVVRPPGKM